MINDLLMGAYNRSPIGSLTGAAGYNPTDITNSVRDAASLLSSIGTKLYSR